MQIMSEKFIPLHEPAACKIHELFKKLILE